MNPRADSETLKAGHAFKRHGAFYPWFDYVRAAAALGVFAAHADHWQVLPSSFGNAAVQVFFVLSGFLIGGILLDTPARDIPRFYFNRATRIWIPYFIALGMVVAATLLKQPLTDPKLWEILLYKLTFVYNLFGPPQLAQYVQRFPLQGTANHFWSICVEEQFYLIAPFVVIFLRRSAAILLAGALAANFFFPHDFASISIGVLLALSRQRFGEWYLRPPAAGLIGLGLAALLAGLFRWPEYYAQLFPFAAGAIVALAATTGSQHRFGRIAGGMSFPFYLNTWVVVFAVNFAVKALHADIAPALMEGITLTFAIGFALLHYWLIDRTIAEQRSAFYSRKLGIAACAMGFGLVLAGVIAGLVLRHAVNAG